MNVSALGASAPTPAPTGASLPAVAVPGVAKLGATTDAHSATRRASTKAEELQRRPDPPPPPKLPPLKPLSTTEIRVMLGALPAKAAGQAAVGQQLGGDGARFDSYA